MGSTVLYGTAKHWCVFFLTISWLCIHQLLLGNKLASNQSTWQYKAIQLMQP